MTNEQINKVIAETCGWIERPTCTDFLGNPLLPPDYCNDLNAMHEAEKRLSEKQTRTFAFMLAQVLETSPTVDLDDQFLNIHATAIQRAEAFLKTIGKWEE